MRLPPFLRSFYLSRLVFYAGFAAACLFVVSYLVPFFFTIAVVLLLFTGLTLLVDLLLLYGKSRGITARRTMAARLSNGDDNRIAIELRNDYGFQADCTIIDELPYQFQERSWKRILQLEPRRQTVLHYYLKPTERGDYDFGNINIYTSSPLKLVQRRYTFPAQRVVKVYPSYVQMRHYQLQAIGNKLQEAGAKRVRKLGQSMEFEQIKEYVRGDDYRTINWQATARRGDLMVNKYTDERSQQVFCLVNKGRIMKMPFEGMTLLDHAINAALVLSHVAMAKQDKAGLITFAENLDTFLPADKKPVQTSLILEALYKQQTAFLEPDLEKLFSVIRNRITQRSLLVLFTNFESVESLQRDMPFLKRIAHYHLLVVVFFENTELKELIDTDAKTIEDIYIKTIAEKYRYDKKLMVKELQMQGIIAVLTTPQKLTVTALNKYLELKSRQSI